MPLPGVLLPGRDSEIRGTIAKIAKDQCILKRPVNKLFPIKNIYQDTKQMGMAREQKLRRETAVIGKLKRKYKCCLRQQWGKGV